MNPEFKIIIKTLKKKVVELDPQKIEAIKEKRRLQREFRKQNPIEPKEPKIKVDYKNDFENINKSLKNLIGFSVDELNEKLKASKINSVQLGQPSDEVVNIKSKKRK
jgi:hypothetical protein